MTKMKVLHIIDSFGIGGAETWLVATLKYLKDHPEMDLHFDFLATGGKKSVYDDEILQLGSKIFYLEYSYRNILKFRTAFKNILRENRYDAIHDHQDFISGWHFVLALGSLPKIRIAHLHNPYSFVRNYIVNPLRWFSFHFGRLLTVGFATKITGTSNAVMDEYGYKRWPYIKKRTGPVYCGFDVARFRYFSEAKDNICEEFNWEKDQTKIALFVGRIDIPNSNSLITQKNPDFAFSMAKELTTENPGWKFIFAGYKGVLGIAMEKEVIRVGLSDSIRFLGERKDIPMIMAASDVLVFPSLTEGLGMVAVEAQACGLPVLMSDSIPEEAIIFNEIVIVKSLKEGYNSWNVSVKKIFSKRFDRFEYADRIKTSVFSIENSVRGLVNIYSDGDVNSLYRSL